MQLFVGNYGRLLDVEVLDDEGVSPILPLSATVSVYNMDSGTTIVDSAAASVATGSAYYTIPSGSAITSSSAHMLAEFDVITTSGTQKTYPLYFDVLDRGGFLIIDIWRRKVAESAPDPDLTGDDSARHHIDSAVRHINKHYRDTGYTSTLGSISPTPTANDREFFAQVASLMARTAWHAGKGKWRDEELSLDPGPILDEWRRLDALMSKDADRALMTGGVFEVFNRDRVQGDGYKEDSPLYWYRPSGSTAVTSTVGI